MAHIIFTHIAVTFFMTGVIYVIQLLHYPSFHFFPETEFGTKMKWHQYQVSWIVMPAMVVEIATGGWICWKLHFSDLIWNINMLLIICIWLSTAVLQGPTHQKLIHGKNEKHITFLCRTNWIRVLLWSVRSAMLGWFLRG